MSLCPSLVSVLVALAALAGPAPLAVAEPSAPNLSAPAESVSLEMGLGRRRSLSSDTGSFDRWSSLAQARVTWVPKRPARHLAGALDLSVDWGYRGEPLWSYEAGESIQRGVHRFGLMGGGSFLFGGATKNLFVRAALGLGYGFPNQGKTDPGVILRGDLGYGFTLSRGSFVFRGEASFEGNVNFDQGFADLAITLGAGRAF